MNNPLYSPSLEERLDATKSHPEFGRPTTDWPIACRGALNAFTVFLGPSMGTLENGRKKLSGVRDRPVWNSAAGIGHGIGLAPFGDGPKSRNTRWGKLILACCGSEETANLLTALWNLDWSTEANEKDVPEENLVTGLDVIIPLIEATMPRILVTLTNRVYDVLATRAQAMKLPARAIGGAKHRPCYEVSFPGVPFATVVIKPANHPSRSFLGAAQIIEVRAIAQRYWLT